MSVSVKKSAISSESSTEVKPKKTIKKKVTIDISKYDEIVDSLAVANHRLKDYAIISNQQEDKIAELEQHLAAQKKRIDILNIANNEKANRISQLKNDAESLVSGAPDLVAVLRSCYENPKFTVKVHGNMKLRKTDFPKGTFETMKIYFDSESMLDISVFSAFFRMMPEEFIRQLVWAFKKFYGQKFLNRAA